MRVRLSPTASSICALLSHAAVDRPLAAVTVQIQLSNQTMNVSVDDAPFGSSPVSTARCGYRTPAGSYRPYALERMHYSRLYGYSPMPYSIFFHTGSALHGTYEVRKSWQACLRRLHPAESGSRAFLVRIDRDARPAEHDDRDRQLGLGRICEARGSGAICGEAARQNKVMVKSARNEGHLCILRD